MTEQTRKARMLECAIAYAELGWPVLPLWSVDENGHCLCDKKDCSSPGKHPNGKHAPNGVKNATIDSKIINQWFSNSNINVGICTGKQSSLVVLDVDPKHGGNDSLKKLSNIPLTPQVQTGGNGKHFYLKHPGGDIRNSVGTLGPGLDIRAEGGYVVAPPSLHSSGNEYKWLVDPKAPLADIPKCLLKKQATTKLLDVAGHLLYEGQRNNTLTSLAGAMRRKGANIDAIYAALVKENETRCKPLLPDKELKTIATSIGKYEPESGPKPIVSRLADIEPQSIKWFWFNRFPMGKLSLLVGNPGLGKSFLTLYMAARVTIGGSWPDSDGSFEDAFTAPKGSVVLLTAEDDLADTVRPRLDNMGADSSKIMAIEGVQISKEGQKYFDLSQHIPVLEQAIESSKDVKLVIIDPISAYLGGTDSHKNAEVRGILAPLAKLAEKHRVAVIAVSHLNKNPSNVAVYRVMGSLAFIAAARAVWLVSNDKNEEQTRRRLLTPCKTNLSVEPTGLAFSIKDGRVEFESGTLNMTSDEALSAGKDEEEKTALEAAKDFLRQCLEDGPVPSKQVYKEAAENKHSVSTLRRAMKTLGIMSRKSSGPDSKWIMELPKEGLPF